MRKFLIVLALVATPAIAQEDPLAKLRAELEATRAANRANEAKVMADNQALIDKLNKQVAEHEKEYGPTPYRSYYHMPGMSYIKYRAMLRMANLPVRRH